MSKLACSEEIVISTEEDDDIKGRENDRERMDTFLNRNYGKKYAQKLFFVLLQRWDTKEIGRMKLPGTKCFHESCWKKAFLYLKFLSLKNECR